MHVQNKNIIILLNRKSNMPELI